MGEKKGPRFHGPLYFVAIPEKVSFPLLLTLKRGFPDGD